MLFSSLIYFGAYYFNKSSNHNMFIYIDILAKTLLDFFNFYFFIKRMHMNNFILNKYLTRDICNHDRLPFVRKHSLKKMLND